MKTANVLSTGRPTRRDFLKETAVAGGALALASLGCSEKDQEASGTPVQMSIARSKGAAALPEDQGTAAQPPPPDIKRMATKLTEHAIANLGGMRRFVTRGDVVWIKPNIGFGLGPEFAVNTNPDVVATLVRLCLDAGAKQVKVGDNASYGARVTYPQSGIEAAVRAVDGEMVYLKESLFKDVPLNGQRLAEWPLYPEIIESDLVINVPIVKQHGLAKITVCMKNYMGVAGNPRYLWHTDLPTCLTDVTAYMKPRLCVVDAVRVLTDGGPSGGDLDDVRLMGTVAAGTDVVALEAFGAELLGCDPTKGRTMANAQGRGLGQIDYRSLPLREVEIS